MSRGRARGRSPEDQERVRKRFVECARAVFAREGAHGLTMRRLAAEAGYSAGTIYLYFPSRKDLLREVWKEDIQSLRHDLAARTAGRRGLDRLDALLRAYAAFWFARPDHFKAMFLEVERQYATERAAFAEDESVQQVHAFLLEETAGALKEAEGRDEGPEVTRTLCHSLIASVHGVVCLHIANPGFPWAGREAMVEIVVSTMMRGLACAAD